MVQGGEEAGMNGTLGMALLILLSAAAAVWPGAHLAEPASPLSKIGDDPYITVPGPGTGYATRQLGDTARAIAQCPNPYIVRSGETLYTIAARCKVSAASIRQANRLKSDRVRISQRLVIPSAPSSPPSSRPLPIYPTPQP
jgi:LysM domain